MEQQRLCAFILPYYGKLPNYFQVFLNSCGANPEYDWLVFTDDHTEFDYPSNVHVHYETFADMQKRVSNRFDFPVALKAPYKMCDLRPMYGYILEEYLKDYRFWGYCDCDLIFGKLSHFIAEQMLNDYDKIFVVGHLSMMRNTEENNKRFMLDLDGKPLYRTVLQSERAFTFDESYLPTNINRIFTSHGFPIFTQDLSGNTYAKSSIFQLTHFDSTLGVFMTEQPLRAVYTWDDGVLKRSYLRLGEFATRELMYMHFQRRHMDVRIDPANMTTFKILPGSFEPLEVDEITRQNFRSIRWKRPEEQAKHRMSIIKGDAKFWRKKIIAKLLHR
ncbi:DUF6625 family protein [Bifidobacterium callimiconis]|uniref:Uncharacterized protein n=1 Tax=Bifidobacterium callimiconis TaxID=2306973 RepID=A0A430FEI8_9BIFI|nr:DUF6625 family protein [Bifidobacterium callimiconis]RSX51152.1 hypothetical protein D2E23_0997 [Bifidobacterium callimiconis]